MRREGSSRRTDKASESEVRELLQNLDKDPLRTLRRWQANVEEYERVLELIRNDEEIQLSAAEKATLSALSTMQKLRRFDWA